MGKNNNLKKQKITPYWIKGEKKSMTISFKEKIKKNQKKIIIIQVGTKKFLSNILPTSRCGVQALEISYLKSCCL